jgi:endogenous inhibitor of DNA gyrase (YacG/DUF329 family)
VFCRAHRVDPAWRPFCSERCRLQDLARWVDGSYRVRGAERSSLEGENPADDDEHPERTPND